MTGEQLDGKIRDAYAGVEISPEAEARILADLLAAEAVRDGVSGADEHGAPVVSLPAKHGRLRRAWIAPALAASLLVAAFLGSRIMFSPDARDTASAGNDAAEYAVSGSGGGAAENGSAPPGMKSEGAEGTSPDDTAPGSAVGEVVVLTDGRRFAIEDIASDVDDPDGLAWEDAVIEPTGDACEAVLLEDGTVLVRFEGEDVLYRASELLR
ncbi:hypothetical protein EII22_05830 [Coriobacteriales bacterium OH1046]|nr:hypothetical protein EII22_05830 [Coriobacteriales bacterium OH1046]